MSEEVIMCRKRGDNGGGGLRVTDEWLTMGPLLLVVSMVELVSNFGQVGSSLYRDFRWE